MLLLAGFACDHSFWAPVAPRLASKYAVISPDNRGSGQTTAPEGNYTIEQMASDAAALLDHLGVGSAHVVGHSMGGEIALELALSRPERVRSLTLLSTSVRSAERMKTVVAASARMPLHLPAEDCCRAFLPWLFTEAFFETPGAVDAALARMMGNPHPPPLQGLAGQSAAIGRFDASSRAGEIRCPTLILAGADDILTPPACSRDLGRRIPDATVIVLETGAHDLVNETNPELLDTLFAFLSRS